MHMHVTPRFYKFTYAIMIIKVGVVVEVKGRQLSLQKVTQKK